MKRQGSIKIERGGSLPATLLLDTEAAFSSVSSLSPAGPSLHSPRPATPSSATSSGAASTLARVSLFLLGVLGVVCVAGTAAAFLVSIAPRGHHGHDDTASAAVAQGLSSSVMLTGASTAHLSTFLATPGESIYNGESVESQAPWLTTVGQIYNGTRSSSPATLPSRYELIESSNVVAVHLTNVPGTDQYLYLERPDCNNRDNGKKVAGMFDLSTRNWTRVDSTDSVFCAGHTVTATGDVIITGGHLAKSGYADGLKSIRLYNPSQQPTALQHVADMKSGRWYPTATLLPDGKVLIMGGTIKPASKVKNVDFEVWDPATPNTTLAFPVEATYLAQYVQNYYPFNYVMPTGDVFNFCKRVSRVLIAQTGNYRRIMANGSIAAWVGAPRKWGDSISQYPFSGTSVMAALRPPYKSMEVMIFGGAPETSCGDPAQIAGRHSYHMTATWTRESRDAAPVYSFTNWTQEDMGMARLMGDATLLPNGDVILQNGAQTGCAGDAGPGGAAKAQQPNLWAQLYQPDKPEGQRYSLLAASTVPRMYHSVAVLTTNGTTLVSGCDRCSKIISNAQFVNPSGSKCEYRQEIFYPPYALVADHLRPQIININRHNRSNIVRLGYGEVFGLKWDNVSLPITDVSLVAPSSTTHSFNSNQRVVFLDILSANTTSGVLALKTPMHPHIAPPQMYMIFLLSGKNYGSAWWVHLVDKTGAAKKPRA